MRGKINVRYIDFTAARSGNRIFHFSVCSGERIDVPTSVEIPMQLLVGPDRIPLQDCAAISYAKLLHMVETEESDVPRRLRLTASDVLEFRKPAHAHGRMRA